MPVFENSLAFIFLLAIPLLFVLRHFKIFSEISFPVNFADWNGKSFEWNEKSSLFLRKTAAALRILAFVSLIFALADPVIRHQEKIYTSRGADVFFVLDTSPSMASKDIAMMTRLDAARSGIHTVLMNNRGTAFGLVAMGSEAAVLVPPTLNQKVFLERMDSLVPGGLGDGSAIGIGLSKAVYHLISSNAPKKCLVLITDGENNAGSIHPDTASKLAVENGMTVYVLGIGTKGSVPIEYTDPKTGIVRSGFYESDFDRSALEEIAWLGGGRYFGIESVRELGEALSLISRKENVSQNFYYKNTQEQIYDRFLYAFCVFAVFAWFISRIILKEVR